MSKDKKDYLDMQNSYYDEYASQWSLQFRDPVVGSYDAHNNWSDYDNYLFKDFQTNGLVALEYGCGPGRNLVKFSPRFERIDGIDISSINIEKAKINLEHNGIHDSLLFTTSGDNLSEVESESYDVVFAVICFQHICVHEIRLAILTDIHRVLKTGGRLCFQMGYGGKGEIPTASYYDNNYDAGSTNGHADVSIKDESELIDDLINALGYKNYKSDIRQTGPGDNHKNWIWVQVEK
ncbi:SmtA SAM-dependent methyltransferases [uncultured Caudovirales phage]|uniref:SmtA SAM-dependent methyltransferases n=1 Tax=uncultured Caudovirales phage TaxID=2100421 RepID=A0A6J5NIV6_9CAUD|nr:SmtA SAM-dependent methyltransferases [uncultured Caudovirales phage]